MSRIKTIAKKAIITADDFIDDIKVHHLRNGEFRKYKDPRRKAIYETVNLTSEQKQEIDDLFLRNYGEKIPYTWHRHFTAFTGNFDKNYLPELLFIPEFEYYMNYNKAYIDVLADKNIIPMIAGYGGVLTPNVFAMCVEGMVSDGKRILKDNEVYRYLSDIGDAFIKPTVGASSGEGCFVVDFHDGKDEISGKPISEILKNLGCNYVVQERLKCHSSISKIYPNSVNTFRVITYRWKDQIYAMPAIMRIGRGNATVDNAHAGGIFVAIENDGTLHKTAFTEFRKSYEAHPDTGLVFDGYKIEGFENVMKAAKRMHSIIPQLGVYNWDFTINEDGEPVLIEVNTEAGSVWMLQMAHGKGAFDDRMPEILTWIRKMKTLKKSQRKEYLFGEV